MRSAGTRIASLGLIIALVLGVASAPVGAAAQGDRTKKPVRIGRLSPLSAEADAPNLAAFRTGLRELGWVEGRTFTIEARFADGKPERLPDLAAELVQRRVDVILTGSSPGALAAKRATATIPIVMVTTGDPVGDGIVPSLARPGGNVTGVTALGQTLNTKRLELLKEAVPGIARVAVLINPASTYTPQFLRERDAAARALKLDILTVEAKDPREFENSFSAMIAGRAGALMVQMTAFFDNHRRKIVELAARNRLPAIYGERKFVDDGGLMFYGASLATMYQDAAVYTDKILKGAKPSDLPVEQPTKLELVINAKAARAIGAAIPQSLLVRADQVVEK
jgi:putative ABC transport system substrate-binding protein